MFKNGLVPWLTLNFKIFPCVWSHISKTNSFYPAFLVLILLLALI